jgi:hypothetical protein
MLPLLRGIAGVHDDRTQHDRRRWIIGDAHDARLDGAAVVVDDVDFGTALERPASRKCDLDRPRGHGYDSPTDGTAAVCVALNHHDLVDRQVREATSFRTRRHVQLALNRCCDSALDRSIEDQGVG